MKKIVFIFLAMVLSTGIAFADDISLKGSWEGTQTQTTTVDATGIGIASSKSDANAIGIGSASVNNSGNSSVKDSGNSTLIVNEVREHIQALPMASFVAAPMTQPEKGWEQVGCENYTMEELANMKKSGRIWDKRGSIFDAATDTRTKSVVRRYADPDNRPLWILDRVPLGTKVLGDFTQFGDYGWPAAEPRAKALLEARKKTNTDSVLVWETLEVDAKNTGLSYGGSVAVAASGTDTAGAGALGAMAGNSYSEKKSFWKVRVVAYEHVSVGPNVCGQLPVLPVILPPPPLVFAPPPPAPPVPVVVEPKKPEPAPPICNQGEIWGKIEKKEAEKCPNLGQNNLDKHLALAYLDIDMYLCSHDATFLSEKYVVEKSGVEFKGAIGHFSQAEKNYQFLKKGQTQIDQKMTEAYKVWAWVIKELFGEAAADQFAAKKGITSYYQDLKN